MEGMRAEWRPVNVRTVVTAIIVAIYSAARFCRRTTGHRLSVGQARNTLRAILSRCEWPQKIVSVLYTGATLNWGVLLAFSEVGSLDLITTIAALSFYGASFAHTIIYDTIYGYQVRQLPPFWYK